MKRVGLGPVVLVAASLAILAGCAAGTSVPPAATFPATTTAPDRPVTDAILQTRAAIAIALGERRLTLLDTQAPFRPSEAPLLATAPRAIYQAWMPQDPDRGLIAVYEFPDEQRASAAAAEQQQWLATGPGRVQSPEGTVHVIRGLGATVIVYDWLPGAAIDATAPDIQAALESIGIPYPIG